MQTLLLRTFILVFLALGIAAACSWNTGVQLKLQPQDSTEIQRQLAEARAARDRAAAERDVVDPPEQRDAAEVEPATPEQAPEVPAAAEGGEDPDNEQYVTVKQAFELFELQFVGASQVIFIDARARTEYEKGHIEGSMSLPAGEFGGRIPEKARNYLPGNIVIIYCQGAECHDSHDVAIRLQQANLQIAQIWIFKDGYPAWVEAGHPTSTGPDQLWQ